MKIDIKCWVIIGGLIVSSIGAQDINIQGKVIDEQGNPIVNAEIILRKMLCISTTDVGGNFTITKKITALRGLAADRNTFFGIRRNFLEIGNLYNSEITVFSINGAVINKMILRKQNSIAINKLIPPTMNSQAIIISISSDNKKINLKAVKCGDLWLCDNVTDLDDFYKNRKSAAVTEVWDSLIISKSGKQRVALPVFQSTANLGEIVLYDTLGQNDQYMIGDVRFSVPSKTFKTAFTVTMTTSIPNAEIRYTTDGTVPSVTSNLFSGNAISISKTTQLRAAAFVGGVLTGNMSTTIYIARNFDYTSEIPIIIMEGYGKGKPADKYNFIDLAFMTFEPVNGVASLDNPPTLVTRAGYHLRGQSSMQFFKQAPYRIELWDNYNEDADYPVLGMPSGSDWALISPCTDNTLIRNVLAFDIGKAIGLTTVQYRFAEVFVNQDGGALENADYEGIYNLIQPIKNKKNTLDLKKLRTDDTDSDKLSGGYIFKLEWAVTDSDMVQIECSGAPKMSTGGGFGWPQKPVDTNATCFSELELVDPGEPNSQQMNWITNYIMEFHNALHAKPTGDYQKYIQLSSFVNMHILNEVSCDIDAWIRSHYFYKERNQPITAGPVWDYNFAFGNMQTDHGKWHCEQQRTGSSDWHVLMWKQPEFKAAFKTRYKELRQNILTDASMEKFIEDVRKPIKNVAQRNFDAWPMGKCSNMMVTPGGGGVTDQTWEGQVDSLKAWTKKRLKNLDNLVESLP